MSREIGWGQTDILLYQVKQQIKKSAQTGAPVAPTTTTTTTLP